MKGAHRTSCTHHTHTWQTMTRTSMEEMGINAHVFTALGLRGVITTFLLSWGVDKRLVQAKELLDVRRV